VDGGLPGPAAFLIAEIGVSSSIIGGVTAADRELTARGLVLGALITVIFTAANVYLGLKVGLTFASSIPAAVISMAALRVLGRGTILENNMVQTQASAAGTLSSVIFVLPGLIMVGHWHGFPFWQSAGVCGAGGVLGVLFTIPLRRAMVVQSTLPYPEGVAAAEILRVGHGASVPGEPGAGDIAIGAGVSAAACFASTGLHVLGEGISQWLTAGGAVFRLCTGFSLALLGAGYLVGIAAGLAMLWGAVISWGIAVPVLTALHPAPAGVSIAVYATGLWATKVRFLGAGVIAVSAIWALAGLLGPTIAGVRQSLKAGGGPAGAGVPRTEQDMSLPWIGAVFLAAMLVMAWVFYGFLSDSPPAVAFGIVGLVVYGCVFCALFGFLVAAACGYMAGLVGSSSSPISGIAIIATILTSLILLLMLGAGGVLASDAGQQAGIAIALFTVSVVLATATVSNDNLQDLKTGYLVGATPWRQQVALVVGCIVGALVIPPVLDLLYNAYGFSGALPHAGMDAGQALAAPQATLMAAIARGIFGHTLDWLFIGIGVALGVAMIVADAGLKRLGRGGLPVLAVGIGIYLPPTVGVTLAMGAILGWVIDRRLRGRPDAEQARRRGVLIASGLIVGESLVGVAMAAVIGASGSQAPLALVGAGFAPVANWAGLAVFALIAAGFAARVLRRGTA
jgi:putative OPT family oligopeptide transporter